jgi:hypothetical protein
VVVIHQPREELTPPPAVDKPLDQASVPPKEAVAAPVAANSDVKAPPEVLKPIPGPDPAGSLTRIEHKPEELNRLLKILKAYQEDRLEEALQLVKQYAPKDQELLLTLLPIIAQVERKGSWTERLDATQKLAVIETLRSLTVTLQQSAPLRIKKAEFARNVTSFGHYDPLASPVFRPGDRAELYAELENLNDRRFNDERCLVRLSSTLIILENERFYRQLRIRSTEDWSRSERQDHYVAVRFSIPPDIQPGVYTLLFKVKDVDSDRETEKTLAFRVASQTAARSGD